MKKMNIFKIALTLVMVFAISGAFAQILTDYDETNATDMYQTTGTTFRLYALPDPIYSPTYVAAANAPLGVNSEWEWNYPIALTGAPATATPAAQNWVEFTVTPIGIHAITVEESNTLTGCGDATPISQTVNIVAAPTATITTGDAVAYCGDQVAQAVSISFVENVPDANAAFGFAVQELVEEIDGADAWIATVSTTDIFVDFTLAAKAKFPADLAGGTPNYTYGFNTSALTVSSNNRTRYTYTLLEASDAGVGSDGIISAISQKSDYIDGLQTYAFTDDNVVFIVNPAPVTGPIYHIGNLTNY
ncbi:MAG: hypothetical protein PF485_15100 [Bacteroidales bacterium]|jgi:hypothetical protein|nr:hypothetical protein [Bacteroidales bacterium]